MSPRDVVPHAPLRRGRRERGPGPDGEDRRELHHRPPAPDQADRRAGAVGESKARVNVLHEKLTGAEQAAELKAYWRDRLTALKVLLETDGDHR
ncbi:hypothetical protein AB0K35_14820 [Micromonospora sp. NPDC053740]|uniref:hypothetical protein n=1 Tax=Micromonospora sp. NPDC053740 TaxID=3155173 RepID=UPI00342ADC1F